MGENLPYEKPKNLFEEREYALKEFEKTEQTVMYGEFGIYFKDESYIDFEQLKIKIDDEIK